MFSANSLFDESMSARLNPEIYPGFWHEDSALIAKNSVKKLDDAMINKLLPELLDSNLTPVVSIGSNASPAQLRHKFNEMNLDNFEIHSFKARIKGIAVGYSSFIASYGYIPATLYANFSSELRLIVQFFNEKELAIVDDTEYPHYKRVELKQNSDISVSIGDHDLDSIQGYVARGGFLSNYGKPLNMKLPTSSAGMNQEELWSYLIGRGYSPVFGRSMDLAQRKNVAKFMLDSDLVTENNILYELEDMRFSH